MKLNFTVLLLLVPSLLLAQFTIEGTITDQQEQPVPYVNVILLEAASQKVFQGMATDEAGEYSFEGVPQGEYLLRASFVGFEIHEREIAISQDMEIPPIVLAEVANNLDEVAITIKNPTVIREVDRLVFSVENSTLSSGTTWDILKRTPMVIESGGSLQVRNQPVAVYINDRKVQLSQSELQALLENYAGDHIEKVEVITNPPARYEAEGGAILNIVTSGNITPGYKGSVQGTWSQAVFPKYQLGTSHYFKTDRLNLFASYSYNPRKEFKEDQGYINYQNPMGPVEAWDTHFQRTSRSKAHNAMVILDYKLGEFNSLSFSSNLLLSPDKESSNRDFTQINNSTLAFDRFATQSNLNEDLNNMGFDLEYRHQLSDAGAQLTAKAHYTRYDHKQDQQLETDFEQGARQGLTTQADQGIDIVTGQVDIQAPVGGSWMEAGIKTSMVSSESSMEQNRSDGGILPEGFRDNFIYDENVYAGYASLAHDWDSWSLKAGLRGEYTDRSGDSRSMEQVDSKEYFELFPTFYLMHSPNENHSFSFDYSRRIQRPRYQSLNPYRYYLNQYNFTTGNPDLKEAISNNFNLNYTFQGMYFLDFYYRDNGPSIETLSFQDYQDRSLRAVSVNLLESISYGLDLSHGRSLTSFWYAYAYVSFFHEQQRFYAETENAEVTNDIDGVYASLYNSLSLSQDGTFSGELNLTYISNWLSGSYELDPMTTLSFGVRKTLWDNRAEVSLHLEDVLDQTNTWMRSNYLNQDNGFFAQPESRFVRLGFKYNFGNFRLSDNQRALEAVERERL